MIQRSCEILLFQPTNPEQEHLAELLAAARRRPAERDELDGQGRHAHHLGAAAARPEGAGAAGEAGPGQAPVRGATASPTGLRGYLQTTRGHQSHWCYVFILK